MHKHKIITLLKFMITSCDCPYHPIPPPPPVNQRIQHLTINHFHYTPPQKITNCSNRFIYVVQPNYRWIYQPNISPE